MLCQVDSSLTTNKFSEINESDLLELLKNYYRLCRANASKQALIKDPALIQMICSLLTDQRQTIAIYVCKILLLLSERPEDAALLAGEKELKSQLEKAFQLENDQVVLPPKILNKLFIVQTRISSASQARQCASTDMKSTVKKTIFGAQRSKQLIFAFDHASESQRREIERRCVTTPGVVSICFQPSDVAGDELRCLIRCRESVDDKVLIHAILSAGALEMVKQLVRDEHGRLEEFNFYASDLEQHQMDVQQRHKENKLPKYLDDQELFDPSQCLASKEQVEAENASGWLSSLKSMFW